MNNTLGFKHDKPLRVIIQKDIPETRIKVIRKAWNRLKDSQKNLIKGIIFEKFSIEDYGNTIRLGTFSKETKHIKIFDKGSNSSLEEAFFHELGHAVFHKHIDNLAKHYHLLETMYPITQYHQDNLIEYSKTLSDNYENPSDDNSDELIKQIRHVKEELFCDMYALNHTSNIDELVLDKYAFKQFNKTFKKILRDIR